MTSDKLKKAGEIIIAWIIKQAGRRIGSHAAML